MLTPKWVQCNGEAHHPEVDYDHCMVCLPHWGNYPVCTVCERKLKNWKCPDCGLKYNSERS